MTSNYTVIYPEMNETAPEGTTVEASVSHGGGFYIKSYKEFSGRGIRSAGKTTTGKNTYHVTELAFDKICKAENVVTIAML